MLPLPVCVPAQAEQLMILKTGEQNSNVSSDLKSSGEPCAVKVACTVRKGGVGKVSLSHLFLKRITRWRSTLPGLQCDEFHGSGFD